MRKIVVKKTEGQWRASAKNCCTTVESDRFHAIGKLFLDHQEALEVVIASKFNPHNDSSQIILKRISGGIWRAYPNGVKTKYGFGFNPSQAVGHLVCTQGNCIGIEVKDED